MRERSRSPNECGKLTTCQEIGALTIQTYRYASALEQNTLSASKSDNAVTLAKGELTDSLAHLSQFNICVTCPLSNMMSWMAAEVS